MNESHLAYLNLGSNIEPEMNLRKAVGLLSTYGKIQEISNVWESKSVGARGPNYLNVCAAFESQFTQAELKERVIRPIEMQLGRKRNQNKYAPRPIDIDIILFDAKPAHDTFWELAYVVVPLAEIHSEYRNPVSGEKVGDTASRLRQVVWLEMRPGVLGWCS